MRIEYFEITSFPGLAWLMILGKDKVVEVYHGSKLEIKDNFFHDGIWDDAFEEGNFHDSPASLGSGVRLFDKHCIISTSSHVMERVFYNYDQNFFMASNSLPLIMEALEDDLDYTFYEYESILNSIVLGVDRAFKKLKLRKNTIYILYYSNIILLDDLSFEIVKKNISFEGKSFEDYASNLKNMLIKFEKNASDKGRKTKFDFVSTISKGYDALASTIIAKNSIALNTVFTINEPEKYKEDDGSQLAKKLKINNIYIGNANEYLNNEEFIETDFILTGDMGSGLFLTAFSKHLKNKVLIMGQRGGRIWDINTKGVNADFKFENEMFPATSLNEYRLSNIFVILPLPLMYGQEWAKINQISNSEELSVFSIEGEYDRPIARKIIEECGIRRDEFANKKIGVGINFKFDNKARIKRRLSKTSYERFLNFYKENKKYKLKHVLKVVKFIFKARRHYLNYILSKIKLPLLKTKQSELLTSPFLPRWLFYWSVFEKKKQYKIDPSLKWWIK